jgi:hypothetical protein
MAVPDIRVQARDLVETLGEALDPEPRQEPRPEPRLAPAGVEAPAPTAP